MNDINFQDKLDANNLAPKKYVTQNEIQILLNVIDRNNPEKPALFETQVTVRFWDGDAELGRSGRKVYIEDNAYICYLISSMALAYFCHLNYSEKPEDVKKFIEATKNKTWYFDSVIL